MNSRLISRVALVLVIGLVWFLVPLPVVAQTTPIKLITDHWKNEPVEITKIMLDGRELKPNETVTSDNAWPSRLEITVKNVSDKPVSWIQVSAWIPRGESDTDFAASYEFRNRGLLQVNETATLTSTRDVIENVTSSSPTMKILVQRVEWNNDRSRRWSAGKILRFDPNTNGYVPDN